MTTRRSTVSLALLALGAAALSVPATSSALGSSAPASSALAADTEAGHGGPAGLPLGPADLAETRTTTELQPGVTLTRIVRGQADPAARWTVEVAIPADGPDPDAPPTALSSEAAAQESAATLRSHGLEPVVEKVVSPRLADAGGELGYRVRVGAVATRAEADAIRQQVRATGLGGSSIFTGWDGEADDLAGSAGPWHVDVLTIDPIRFGGTLAGSYGPDLERRETTSALAALTGATAAVNAGFFVLDPRAGAPGDPAGVAAYGGRLVSEPVRGRPALVVRDDARGTSVVRLDWAGKVAGPRGTAPLDGLNRVPGLIRNCGGTGDTPTIQPLHDVTCTDADELVAFDPSYGASTPAGPGAEVVLDRTGLVTAVNPTRGTAVPAGGRTVQATGSAVDDLLALARVGSRLRIDARLIGEHGRTVSPSARTAVLNGGPELVRDGRLHATPRADGMAPAGNPSFYYGWAHKRNPRTLAGVDGHGRTVLITADGRSTESLGLGIAEAAAVAKSLGLQDAINLDGGGSTTMVVGGVVVNDPSDAAGERPVGDALVILP